MFYFISYQSKAITVGRAVYDAGVGFVGFQLLQAHIDRLLGLSCYFVFPPDQKGVGMPAA